MADLLCPEDCEVALPAGKFDECAPEVNDSQINVLLIAKGDAVPFEDWSDPLEWAARLDQAAVGDKIRKLTGIGSMAKPSAAVRNISNGRKLVTNRGRAVNFKVDETNQLNYDAMRGFQCGGIYTVWYGTIGGLLFGGNEGIKVSIDAGEVLPEGDEEIMILDYLVEWKNKISPERIVSPL